MAFYDKDEVPMLSDIHPQSSENNKDSRFQTFFSRTQSASISIPMHSIESYENTNLVGHTGPLRNERKTPFIQMSGPLYISRKPENSFYLNQNAAGRKMVESKAEKFPSFNGMDEKDWSDNNYVGKNEHLLRSGQLGMCNDPYCTTCPTYYNFKAEQQKNSKASGIFDAKFRLAYIAPESRVVGAGELVDHPKKIAVNYLSGYFFLDLFVVLPFPQIMISFVLPKYLGSEGANYAKSILCTAILIQYLPRLYRFLPFLAGQSPRGFIFESAWENFVINLLTFMLSGHVVGSCWYLFGLQRVNQCLQNACSKSYIKKCMEFIDCGYGHTSNHFESPSWKNNANVSACFTKDGFSYGIYGPTVNLTTERSIVTRYVYSLFWGFQQISTLAGNQTPSYFIWEVLFTMAIVGLGLLLFALLIGNMQNFLQALGRRRLEMSLRRRDVEQWMSHRRLPAELRRKVREAERYNWAATRGVNEEMLFENLPEDLQRDIRRHLFKFVKKVRFFAILEDPILDAICERLRQKTYIKGSNVLSPGNLIERVVFIVRGKMESVGENGIKDPLSEGDVCGEELLTWCLEHSSVNRDGKKIRIPAQRLLSNRNVRCLTNVEAFSLRAADLEEVTSLFSRFLRNPRVQGAIRYESPYWRSLAATRIQVAWRYRKKCLNRSNTSQSANPLG
ncbi:probable cyclic nucleotide-gated ion channel 20, chloroplastic isoform X6 [Durio zibethinus]|uniref:Probable cyclic nucleotide-gated ion channel 20, chloroplastic isoform X6 n=1 Tax=Durio zibethinus TaxID=66656 RepID=A0A6P5XDC6_DURZI|nr:probable cyclic nucleotide-gated ion channel 20, chloroplastic isoform X6 [Durio zibethinus]